MVELNSMGGGSNGSDSSGVRKRALVLCKCGKEAMLTTSWTTKNLGRRFYGCDKGKNGCNYFSWHDPQVNPREKKVINKC